MSIVAKSQRGTGFGARLKAAREAVGLTQAELAEAAGVHRVDISRYENGAVTDPAFSVVCDLADALGVSVAELRNQGDTSAG